jgi:type IV pilus assembly protein PilB
MNVNYVPQDGRFDFETKKWWKIYKIDVRVNFMPALYWESIVMRFLDSSSWIRSFSEIWFIWASYDILNRNIEKPYWMILVTWPTGSGKSTTLYSILNKLNLPDKKIITLEDPVEYSLPNIQQSQINPDKWYTYAEWLKAILRQDPDIIMVWEIRDLETAKIAINAALTWHLVLSTLHTNTAIEAVSRLINMWVEPFMLAPALNLVIWQRLLRKLCDCKTSMEANSWEKEDIKFHLKKINNILAPKKIDFDGKIFKETWCEKCAYDGFSWRIAVVEAFELTDEIKNMIISWSTSLDIFHLAREWGYLTMQDDAYIKMLKWLTTLDEIRRVLNS